MSETWRPDTSEIWETHQKHIVMGAGKYDNKHGVGIEMNKKWRQKNKTHQTVERVLLPLGICGPSRRKKDRTIEKHTTNSKNCIPIVGGDSNAELGPGYGTECTSVGKHTLNGENKRGDWVKHWLTLQNFTALNMMYRKTHADANDMIHKGSDHRCVMATFVITTPKKGGPFKKKRQARDSKT